MNTPLCEVRVPTFRRPELVERALTSLLNQTCENWVALVFDDSPEQEARRVVEGLGDARIRYRPNATRIGGAANLDRAFVTRSLAAAPFACVLEDDNWYLPEFLTDGIARLRDSGARILLRNQLVWDQQSPESGEMTRETTRGEWLEERVYVPVELRGLLLMFEGISNGGLLWDTSAASDFVVGTSVTDPGLQEYCRTLQIREPILFAAEPLGVWTRMPPTLVTRKKSRTAMFRAAQAQICRYVLGRWGDVALAAAQHAAARAGREELLALRLVYAHPVRFAHHARSLRSVARGVALRFLPGPFDRYFLEHAEYLMTL